MSKTKEGVEVKVGQIWSFYDGRDLRVRSVNHDNTATIEGTDGVFAGVIWIREMDKGWKLIKDVQ